MSRGFVLLVLTVGLCMIVEAISRYSETLGLFVSGVVMFSGGLISWRKINKTGGFEGNGHK